MQLFISNSPRLSIAMKYWWRCGIVNWVEWRGISDAANTENKSLIKCIRHTLLICLLCLLSVPCHFLLLQIPQFMSACCAARNVFIRALLVMSTLFILLASAEMMNGQLQLRTVLVDHHYPCQDVLVLSG